MIDGTVVLNPADKVTRMKWTAKIDVISIHRHIDNGTAPPPPQQSCIGAGSHSIYSAEGFQHHDPWMATGFKLTARESGDCEDNEDEHNENDGDESSSLSSRVQSLSQADQSRQKQKQSNFSPTRRGSSSMRYSSVRPASAPPLSPLAVSPKVSATIVPHLMLSTDFEDDISFCDDISVHALAMQDSSHPHPQDFSNIDRSIVSKTSGGKDLIVPSPSLGSKHREDIVEEVALWPRSATSDERSDTDQLDD
jgi:hypothetical protein